ncbi:MAG: acylphosphatase [Alphaproteobacteria bacterium]
MSERSGAIARRVRIEGRVQGVWYRAWTLERAQALGLRGWVRNRSDGCVEAVFAGPAHDVRTMIEACRRGPPRAVVDRLTEAPVEDEGFNEFRQLPTG